MKKTWSKVLATVLVLAMVLCLALIALALAINMLPALF